MPESANEAALERARLVLRNHRDRLMADHGASGVGVSLDDTNRPVIIVYLLSGRPLPPDQMVDGIPLIFKVRGTVKPM
jgi:hypothetical protein